MSDNDRLIYLVFTSELILRNYLKTALLKSGLKVTVTQSGILFLLKQKDGRTMTDLSQILGLDNSTLTGLVDRMEKNGLVKRNSNPVDRRSSHIYITENGLMECREAAAVIRRTNDEIKSGFSEDEVTVFKKILKSFLKKFNGDQK
jgi:DNA-binding MarR family transcriptional regulator